MALFIFILAAPILAEETAQPRLYIPEPEINFGRVLSGEPVEVIFIAQNKGNAPLHISKIQTSCGCATAFLDKPKVLPGETARIQVIFQTRGRFGAQTKIIHFKTNDPNQSQAELRLIGTLQPYLKTEPEILFFQGEETSPLFFYVHNFSNPQFEIIAFSASSNKIKLTSLTPLNTPGSVQRFQIELKEGYPQNKIYEKVALFTNDPLQPIIWIPVWGRTQ